MSRRLSSPRLRSCSPCWSAPRPRAQTDATAALGAPAHVVGRRGDGDRSSATARRAGGREPAAARRATACRTESGRARDRPARRQHPRSRSTHDRRPARRRPGPADRRSDRLRAVAQRPAATRGATTRWMPGRKRAVHATPASTASSAGRVRRGPAFLEVSVVRGEAACCDADGASVPLSRGRARAGGAGPGRPATGTFNSALSRRVSRVGRDAARAARRRAVERLPAAGTAGLRRHVRPRRLLGGLGRLRLGLVPAGRRPTGGRTTYGGWYAVTAGDGRGSARDRWAWPTHHYGRWGYGSRRLVLDPGRGWGPAWVSWGFAPAIVSWCPLGLEQLRRCSASRSAGRSATASPWRGWTVVPQPRVRTGAATGSSRTRFAASTCARWNARASTWARAGRPFRASPVGRGDGGCARRACRAARRRRPRQRVGEPAAPCRGRRPRGRPRRGRRALPRAVRSARPSAGRAAGASPRTPSGPGRVTAVPRSTASPARRRPRRRLRRGRQRPSRPAGRRRAWLGPRPRWSPVRRTRSPYSLVALELRRPRTSSTPDRSCGDRGASARSGRPRPARGGRSIARPPAPSRERLVGRRVPPAPPYRRGPSARGRPRAGAAAAARRAVRPARRYGGSGGRGGARSGGGAARRRRAGAAPGAVRARECRCGSADGGAHRGVGVPQRAGRIGALCTSALCERGVESPRGPRSHPRRPARRPRRARSSSPPSSAIVSGIVFAYAGDLPQISALDDYAPEHDHARLRGERPGRRRVRDRAPRRGQVRRHLAAAAPGDRLGRGRRLRPALRRQHLAHRRSRRSRTSSSGGWRARAR